MSCPSDRMPDHRFLFLRRDLPGIAQIDLMVQPLVGDIQSIALLLHIPVHGQMVDRVAVLSKMLMSVLMSYPTFECVYKTPNVHFQRLRLHFHIAFPRLLRTAANTRSVSGGSAAGILWIPARAGRACLWQWRDCYCRQQACGKSP